MSGWQNPPEGVAELQAQKHKTTTLQTAPCPHCGYSIDRTLGPHLPRPGDILTCFDCGNVSAFDDNLGLRKLTEDEEIEAATDPMVRAARNIIQLVKRLRGK